MQFVLRQIATARQLDYPAMAPVSSLSEAVNCTTAWHCGSQAKLLGSQHAESRALALEQAGELLQYSVHAESRGRRVLFIFVFHVLRSKSVPLAIQLPHKRRSQPLVQLDVELLR